MNSPIVSTEIPICRTSSSSTNSPSLTSLPYDIRTSGGRFDPDLQKLANGIQESFGQSGIQLYSFEGKQFMIFK
jgi:hypothetical protein